jgi:hypothetical protein
MSYKTSKVWTGSEWAGIAVAVANSQQKTIGNQDGTTLTLSTTIPADTYVFSSSSSITVTIPVDASDEFIIGQTILLIQNGTGTVTIAGAVGVTVNGAAITSSINITERYGVATLIKIANNSWIVFGNVA